MPTLPNYIQKGNGNPAKPHEGRWTVQDIATTFGVQPRAVEEWLSLTDVAPEVREAIQAGEIAAGVGVALANIPREQQAAKLAEMKAENGGQIPVHVARGRLPYVQN